MSIIIKEDKVIEPEGKKFICSMIEFTGSTTMDKFDKMSYENCKIKTVPTRSGKTELNNLNVAEGFILVPFSEMGFGLINKDNFDTYYQKPYGPTADTLKRYIDGTNSIDSLYFLTRKVKIDGAYDTKFYAFKFKEDFYDYFQTLVVNDLQVTEDYNLIPKFPFEEVKVHYINDETRSFAEEGYLKDYFTDKYIAVNGSSSYFLDTSTGRMDLLNNFMYFNNKTVEYTLKLVKDQLKFYDSTGEVAEMLEAKKIYQCAVWHNVLPFALNPRDSSWCGVAFSYGHRTELSQQNVRTIYIKQDGMARDCIMQARMMQKSLYELCSSDDADLHNLIFSPVDKKEENSAKITGQDATGKNGATSGPNDATPKASEAQIAYNMGAAELQLLDAQPEADVLPSKAITLTDKVHGPSDARVGQMEDVMRSLILNFELDPAIYYSPELLDYYNNYFKYHPHSYSQPEMMDMFNQTLDLQNKNSQEIKFTQSNSAAHVSESSETQYKDIVAHRHVSKPMDTVFSNVEIRNSVMHWVTRLNDIAVSDLTGRGKDVGSSDVYFQNLAYALHNVAPTLELSKSAKSDADTKPEVFDYFWYRLEVDRKEGTVVKKFKTDGVLNGDVLTQKFDCCAILSTDVGSMIITICPKTMQFAGKDVKKWFNVYGVEIKQSEFQADYNECGPPPEPKGNLDIRQLNGAIVIPNYKSKDNQVTTVKDGKIIQDDGKVNVLEDLASMSTLATVGKEKVLLKPNSEFDVNEKIVDADGNTLSDKMLDENDQTMNIPGASAKPPGGNVPMQYDAFGKPIPSTIPINTSIPNPKDLKALGELNELSNGPKTKVFSELPGDIPEVGNGNILDKAKLNPLVDGMNNGYSDESGNPNSANIAIDPLTGKPFASKPNSNLIEDGKVIIDPLTGKPVSIDPLTGKPYNKDLFDPITGKPLNKLNSGEVNVTIDPATGKPINPEINSTNNKKPKNLNNHNPADSAQAQDIQIKEDQIKPDGTVVKDIGNYEIYVDKDDKVTVHVKNESNRRGKLDKITKAYRLGAIVFVHFESGDYLKHYLITGETVKIYADKNTIGHFYPDNSYYYDTKDKKVKEFVNKYGVKATFDLNGNKFKNEDVKKYFKYGSDVVYVLNDDTVIVKKSNGETVVMNPDDTMQILNKDGIVTSQDNMRFRLKYILHSDAPDAAMGLYRNSAVLVHDSKSGHKFPMFNKSKLIRNKNRLYEILPGKIQLEIVFIGENWYKKREFKNFEERCYANNMGIKFNSNYKNQAWLCKCSEKFTIDSWGCQLKDNKSAVFAEIFSDLKKNNLWKDQQMQYEEKYQGMQDLLKSFRLNQDKYNTLVNNSYEDGRKL